MVRSAAHQKEETINTRYIGLLNIRSLVVITTVKNDIKDHILLALCSRCRL
ncbi:hypothetical protein YC2023_019093 [Brassica napus]